MKNIIQTLQIFIKENWETAQINPTEDLIKSGILDSVGIFQIAAFIKSEYKISLSDTDLKIQHFESLNSIKALIESKLDDCKSKKQC